VALTLADLLTAKTEDEIETQLISVLQTQGFPVSDYNVGGVARTIIKMVRAGIIDLANLVPLIASGGFLDYASGDWLTLLAGQLYGLTRTPAVYAKQRLKLTHEAGTGPTDIEPGSSIALSTNQRRWLSNDTVTVPADDFEYIEYIAESAGAAYNGDGAGQITSLVTPLPGLVVTNPEQSFGGVTTAGKAVKAGSGSGVVTPSETVAEVMPTPARTFSIKVTTSANGTGSGAIQLTVMEDGVATVTAITPIPASYAAGGGVTIGFANGAANTVSWLAGDIYSFTTPGSPLIQQGADEEGDVALRARCRGRWPALSLVPTADRYEAWIIQASIEGGYGITKIKATPSSTVAGTVNLYVAGAAGAPAGAVITALQTYIDLRDGIVDLAIVEAAVNKDVDAGGTVLVRVANAAAVKAAAKTNWEAYLSDLAIGGSQPGGVVRLEELTEALMAAGAVDVSGLTLDAVAANLALAETEVAVPGNDITSALTWTEVA
jgi:hypothetical protein